MATKTFTAGQVLTAADTNTYLANAGLVYVSTTTWSAGATSIPVNNCFSSTYDNYRVLVNIESNSGGASHTIALNGITTLYYVSGHLFAWGTAGATAYSPTVQPNWIVSANNSNGNPCEMVLDIINPFRTVRTTGSVMSTSANGSAILQMLNTNTTSATGFTIAKGGDTMTGGSVVVYGYRKP